MPATTFSPSPSPETISTMGTPKLPHLRIPNGVYVPTISFFTAEDEIDVAAFEKHIVRLINAGVSGFVVQGSNGEVAHLTHDERATVIRVVRDTILNEASETPVPLIAGCGAQSTKETVQLCVDAAAAGATHALVLPPSYYGTLISDKMLVQFFYDVADRSPIPVLIYNFPGAAAGRDLSSDIILEIAQHPNVTGVKLTCGNTGKLARVADSCPEGFFVGGGSADFILQGYVVGANGTISGLANLCPRACIKIIELADEGRLKEARDLQAVVARADWMAIRTGFVGVKAALGHFEGYGGEPRRPCMGPGMKETEAIVEGFQAAMDVEAML